MAETTMALARKVPVDAGPLSHWSSAWATETLAEGKVAFEGMTFSSESPNDKHQVNHVPPGYAAARTSLQVRQVAKAGARLAHVLRAIWPD
jgi:hypothetical protein